MASSHPLPRPSNILDTLRYFDKYDYPLTKEELVYWQSPTTHPASGTPLFTKERGRWGEFFFLPGRQKIVTLRMQRAKISLKKWTIAQEIGERLRKFTFIQAIFVTGSLAMNNATAKDDIDLMVVTSANALWITRFLVNIYLSSVRRYPHQKRVANVVCTNLWLDTNNLFIQTHNLYTAHEIVQARVLWDRNNIHVKFLAANPWIKNFLPNAYKPQASSIQHLGSNLLFWPLNLFFFLMQYLYMKRRMTTERVSPGSAFFHPRGY